MRPVHILVTCEHAGNQVPKAYSYLFRHKEEVLKSHRGVDVGAKAMAHTLSDGLRAKLIETDISRLLVDCNRSADNAEVFSEFTRELKPDVKKYILDHYYHPYRRSVEDYIAKHVANQPVLHLSMHTFTPVWKGEERPIDVALLFDEERRLERHLCAHWTAALHENLEDYQVLNNEPYKGTDDGFTTYLRTRFSEDQYLGIEIEVNHKWSGTSKESLFMESIIEGLEVAISQTKFS